jgi:hypothetical protein
MFILAKILKDTIADGETHLTGCTLVIGEIEFRIERPVQC